MSHPRYGEIARTMYELYKRNPEEALDYAFANNAVPYSNEPTIFIWTGLLGTCLKTRYGSYKYVKKSSLVGRKYEIEFMDGNIGIHYTDVLHDPRTYKSIPINEKEKS
jgi:hypothetical protein